MRWSSVYDTGAATCSAVRKTWDDGDEGVFGVVLADGFVSADRVAHGIKTINLRLEFLLPRPIVHQDSHYVTVAATSSRSLRLALLECGQEGCKIMAGYCNYM
jgi:hypothetical protein